MHQFILEKVFTKYVKGTEFYGVFTGNKYESTGEFIVLAPDVICTSSGVYVYFKGHWAPFKEEDPIVFVPAGHQLSPELKESFKKLDDKIDRIMENMDVINSISKYILIRDIHTPTISLVSGESHTKEDWKKLIPWLGDLDIDLATEWFKKEPSAMKHEAIRILNKHFKCHFQQEMGSSQKKDYIFAIEAVEEVLNQNHKYDHFGYFYEGKIMSKEQISGSTFSEGNHPIELFKIAQGWQE